MTIQRGNYNPAGSQCIGRAGVTAKTYMSYLLAAHPGFKNLGIYNCALIPGSDVLSVHAVGRALDFGTPNGVPTNMSLLIAEQLRLFSHELGLQGLIHNRRAWWSNYQPGWMAYSGSNPHLDHIHIEIQAKFLDSVTSPLWPEKCLTGAARYPFPDQGHAAQGDKGSVVLALQKRLVAHGYDLYKGLAPLNDGIFGPVTEACVHSFQTVTGIPVTGVADPITWGRLGNE